MSYILYLESNNNTYSNTRSEGQGSNARQRARRGPASGSAHQWPGAIEVYLALIAAKPSAGRSVHGPNTD